MSQAITAIQCLHCGARSSGEFCCPGCAIVHGLLRREGLGRYYDLGGGGVPATGAERPNADHAWLELRAQALAAGAGPTPLTLDIQGLHCAACVWLIEELFQRTAGGVRVLVNPALGRLDLVVEASFPLVEFAEHVERFGYRLGPALKETAGASAGLLVRIGVCAAIAMNSMIFAIAMYAGLRDGPLHHAFGELTFGLAIASVAVGGSVFIGSAWQALRRGILHMDLPIALGILAAFGGSAYSFLWRDGKAAYFDTLDVFILLMLVGRWLQERVLERNRRQLLASDGVDGLLARRLEDGAVRIVPLGSIRAGDDLLVTPGDLLGVDAVLAERASFSLDWISGESTPHELAAGATVPAGAFNVGTRAVVARARTDFAASGLGDLLRAPLPRAADRARATPFWQRLARSWVIGVLVAAGGAFALWLLRTGDPGRALDIATAVLIVTCPCAFGIATPLAYELVQAGLRRAGLFVRSAGFLDRAMAVRRVVFDKTGTLTSGRLRLADDAPLSTLSPGDRRALAQMALRSAHPKSQAVARALPDVTFDPDAQVTEVPGRGLTMGDHFLGAGAGGDLVLSEHGEPRVVLSTVEDLRPDAVGEIRKLRAGGLDVWILSGDTPERVAALADSVGVPDDHAVAGQTPQGKADWLSGHDAGDTLFIGDGINDSLVVDRATCSGTPAIDRPFMPARSDFYFVTPGLRPVRLALDAARRLARLTRRNLGLALAYNVVTVSLAYLGVMSPLLCAVVMPLSSLSIVLSTIASLHARSRIWKS